MKIAICGGTGFIGQGLCTRWVKEGHQIMIVTRSQPEKQVRDDQVAYVTWDDMKQNPQLFEGMDALINLAGSSLSQRWSTKGKERILSSRQKTVAAVANLMRKLDRKPPVVVQASAMAIYGTSEDKTFDENSPSRVMDFPSSVVAGWENAADDIQVDRLVKLRISVVLGNEGGAFPKMILPYKLGFGGKIGSGHQWMSWIHIMDIVNLIDFCIHHPDVKGPVNAASPHPVTNNEFGRTVAKVYHRSHWFPVPAFLLQSVLGELSLILLKGQRMVPVKAEEHGFRFQYPQLTEALSDLKYNNN
ncbi:TIGR01777 family oxidoreductase [Paenibacillus sp. N3/727]|uniref:TIGR01777 family oxidoreductase n=1 Tax=Paenibacillus sp. N3/727 TaxID=2925845 RepID=UPI001F5340FE|nr:TIGR01777 family oxidoreductase [Paenibacillus sp. N3/727]UNK19628.1 TIGR01777 family oxidoreductase [Paenibacillus sp. N3/727]